MNKQCSCHCHKHEDVCELFGQHCEHCGQPEQLPCGCPKYDELSRCINQGHLMLEQPEHEDWEATKKMMEDMAKEETEEFIRAVKRIPEQGKTEEINTEVPTNGEQVQEWEEVFKDLYLNWGQSEGMCQLITNFIRKEKQKSYDEAVKDFYYELNAVTKDIEAHKLTGIVVPYKEISKIKEKLTEK